MDMCTSDTCKIENFPDKGGARKSCIVVKENIVQKLHNVSSFTTMSYTHLLTL